jgi:hypothetical protein
MKANKAMTEREASAGKKRDFVMSEPQIREIEGGGNPAAKAIRFAKSSIGDACPPVNGRNAQWVAVVKRGKTKQSRDDPTQTSQKTRRLNGPPNVF